jgi:hypothetical protein
MLGRRQFEAIRLDPQSAEFYAYRGLACAIRATSIAQ